MFSISSRPILVGAVLSLTLLAIPSPDQVLAQYQQTGIDSQPTASTTIVRIDPAVEYFNQAEEQLEQGEYRRAIEYYNLALRHSATYFERFIYGRGVALIGLKNYKGALRDLSQAIDVSPNFAAAYQSRGVARYRLGDNSGALEDYNQALALNPELPASYYNRGSAKLQMGDRQGAIEDLKLAAKLLTEQGRISDSRRALERAEKLRASS
ncbi:MAG: tetratricopeptide repeat protein [Gemmatimonadaceae bacterium]|nr:tetratricopeptide repeat protein [Gloeobacterales cyanobacterium ES-bin-141]